MRKPEKYSGVMVRIFPWGPGSFGCSGLPLMENDAEPRAVGERERIGYRRACHPRNLFQLLFEGGEECRTLVVSLVNRFG